MAIAKGFSVNLSGTWSARQAEAILKIVKPEGEAMGIGVSLIDVSTFERPHQRIFSMYCLRHDCFVALDSACEVCIREA